MNFIIKWCLLIGLFGGFILYMNKKESDREEAAQRVLQPYNDQIDRYLKRTSISKELIPTKGKAIYVDEKTKRVDKFSDYNIHPLAIPSGPDDVNSVVLHDCEYVQVGAYSNGSKALQQVCNFKVIDVATGVWSAWGEFRGSLPSEEIKRKRGSTSDEKGGKAIYAFLKAESEARRELEMKRAESK